MVLLVWFFVCLLEFFGLFFQMAQLLVSVWVGKGKSDSVSEV
jgi:hypothetical protein